MSEQVFWDDINELKLLFVYIIFSSESKINIGKYILSN